jgi:hypothetical protein
MIAWHSDVKLTMLQDVPAEKPPVPGPPMPPPPQNIPPAQPAWRVIENPRKIERKKKMPKSLAPGPSGGPMMEPPRPPAAPSWSNWKREAHHNFITCPRNGWPDPLCLLPFLVFLFVRLWISSQPSCTTDSETTPSPALGYAATCAGTFRSVAPYNGVSCLLSDLYPP